MFERTAIVTGGGGQNIGQEISKRIADSETNVVIIDKDADSGNGVADRINGAGGEATFLPADVTDPDEVAAAVETAVDKYGGIDILVNNAGGARGVTLEDTEIADFRWNLEQNLISAAVCTRESLPHLRKDGGSVVFLSSINAICGGFSEVAYASAKAGLHALCRGLVADYSSDDVRFNVVCPGSIIGDSETWESREDDTKLKDIASIYPMGRYGRPEDVAEAVEFLCSDRAAWITGVILPIDGGLTATGNLPGGKWWTKL